MQRHAFTSWTPTIGFALASVVLWRIGRWINRHEIPEVHRVEN